SFAIGASWHTGPTEPSEWMLWREAQWIKAHEQAKKFSEIGVCVGSAPILLGAGMRLAGFGPSPTATTVNVIVLSGLALAIGGMIGGTRRGGHPVDGVETGLRWQEAFGSILSAGLYVMVLLFLMPS